MISTRLYSFSCSALLLISLVYFASPVGASRSLSTETPAAKIRTCFKNRDVLVDPGASVYLPAKNSLQNEFV
jgi:hypothetical protein